MKMNKKILVIIIIVTLIVILILCAYTLLCINLKQMIAKGAAPINKFFEERCNDPPVFDSRDFKWTENFRHRWTDILNEFNDYRKEYLIPAYKDVNVGSSGGTEGWKALFLRVFNNDTEVIKKFPKTKKLLDSCLCTAAYFSMLEPGTHIPEHRGVFKGVIRYHLGLKIPSDWENCFIVVDGQKLHWREGKDLMFDDMFLHHVENNTKESRVVLFMDIKRDFKNFMLNAINNIVIGKIATNEMLLKTLNKANRVTKESRISNSDSFSSGPLDSDYTPSESSSFSF